MIFNLFSRNENPRNTISTLIAAKAFKIFLVTVLAQFLVVFISLSYISYQDSVNRASFLAKSSQESLGILLSIGDQFQLRNIIKSYINEETVAVWIHGENDEILFTSDDEETWGTGKYGEVQWLGGNLYLTSSFPIIYNQVRYGKLRTINKIVVKRWLLVVSFFLISSLIFYYVQIRSLKKFSLGIGSAISDIATMFTNENTKKQIIEKHEKRNRTDFYEIEDMAFHIRQLLLKIIDSKSLEKEAAIGRIAAQISHDLRAPLGTFERLLHIPAEKFPSMKISIYEALQRTSAMIESVRNFESEDLVHREKSSIDLMSPLVGLLNRAQDKGVSVEIPENLNETAYVDLKKFERVLANLVSNAIDAARTSVIITWQKDDSSLYLRIIDDGDGVSPDYISSMFNWGAKSNKPGGTGLGLSYVKKVVDGHGGSIKYFRDANWTVFECYFPKVFVQDEDSIEIGPRSDPVANSAKPQKIISLCLSEDKTNKDLFNALSNEGSNEFSFCMGFDSSSFAVITDSDEIVERALQEGKVILEYSDDASIHDMLRKTKIRLGIRDGKSQATL